MKPTKLDTYPVAYVEGLAARVAELERELEQAKADRARAAMDARNPLMAQLAAMEARCKRLEEAARAVYLDSIASDHPWSTNETRNMHALRDVLEAKPAEKATPCPYCLRVECECSDFDVSPDMGDK